MDAGLLFRSQTWGGRVAAFGGGSALPQVCSLIPGPLPILTRVGALGGEIIPQAKGIISVPRGGPPKTPLRDIKNTQPFLICRVLCLSKNLGMGGGKKKKASVQPEPAPHGIKIGCGGGSMKKKASVQPAPAPTSNIWGGGGARRRRQRCNPHRNQVRCRCWCNRKGLRRGLKEGGRAVAPALVQVQVCLLQDLLEKAADGCTRSGAGAGSPSKGLRRRLKEGGGAVAPDLVLVQVRLLEDRL